MAYMKTIKLKCDAAGCEKTATLEVFNTSNAFIGKFCKADAHRALVRVMKLEGFAGEQLTRRA